LIIKLEKLNLFEKLNELTDIETKKKLGKRESISDNFCFTNYFVR
jgi:hypothetical protein